VTKFFSPAAAAQFECPARHWNAATLTKTIVLQADHYFTSHALRTLCAKWGRGGLKSWKVEEKHLKRAWPKLLLSKQIAALTS